MKKALLLLALLSVIAIIVLVASSSKAEDFVREPANAGKFYKLSPEELRKDISVFLSSAKPIPSEGHLVALISPHAGYSFSGQTAAYGYSLLQGKKYSRVIILGTNHRLNENAIIISDYTKYKTPLGSVDVDTDACNELAKNPLFKKLRPVVDTEHSIEVQLPFLQMTLKDFKIVPLIVCELNDDGCAKVAGTLRNFLDENTLFIASSDFTHHGPNYSYVRFTDNIKENLRTLDQGAVEKIAKIDCAGFLKYRNDTDITVCGYKPIAILLSLLPKEALSKELYYTTSGEMQNDFTNSVSYVSMAFTVKELSMLEKDPDELTFNEKKTLVKLAKDTLNYYIKTGKAPDALKAGYEITDRLKKNAEVFVTLRKKDRLRGCIGMLGEDMPLYKAIMKSAISSATHDPRFDAVEEDELSDITIEISVLTPRRKIDDYKKIVIGTHGIVVEKNGCRALFLPQVAPEQGWDCETFLSECCEKAGLETDDWKESCEIYTFRALVFDETVLSENEK
ncbi:MAG: AmmeMemoRadiSam system protein B [Planctomycetes bacterium]|nr:AmmeMemoRadiSam system protein B [Planctomycetota bacterium]